MPKGEGEQEKRGFHYQVIYFSLVLLKDEKAQNLDLSPVFIRPTLNFNKRVYLSRGWI